MNLRNDGWRLIGGFVLVLGWAVAQAQGNIGRESTAELMLNEQESSEVRSTALFTKRLGRVAFSTNNVCLSCGDYWDDLNFGKNHVTKRVGTDFPAFLRKEIYQSGIFPSEVKDRLSMNVVLKDLQLNSTVGAMAERKNPISSGAVLNARLSISYELIEDGQVVGSWLVSSRSSSNSMSPSVRVGEAVDAVIKRNVRSLFLKMIADFNPQQAPRARQTLVAIGSEVDNTRSVLGYLLYGTAVTAGAVGDGLVAVAKNSGAIAAGLNGAMSNMSSLEAAARGSSLEQDSARAALQADFDERVSRQKAISAREASKNPSSPPVSEPPKTSAPRVPSNEANRKKNDAKITLEHAAEEKKAALEKSKQEAALKEQERLAAELAAKEKRAVLAAERKAEQDRIEREEKEKRANYLAAMRQGIRLSARHCPDGEGRHYVVGLRPNIRPEIVSCINVRYTAYCPGSRIGVTGVVKNFLGAGTDCFFGDAATITPKLSCEPKEALVTVETVVGCSD